MDELSTLTQVLAGRLRAARVQSNLTQTELASQLGVSLRTVQDWEGAHTFPRPAHRRAIDSFIDGAKAA